MPSAAADLRMAPTFVWSTTSSSTTIRRAPVDHLLDGERDRPMHRGERAAVHVEPGQTCSASASVTT